MPSDFAVYLSMNTDDFQPPLKIRGRPALSIHTIDQAEKFLRDTPAVGRNREGVLRYLQVANSVEERREAANAFRAWLESAALLEAPQN